MVLMDEIKGKSVHVVFTRITFSNPHPIKVMSTVQSVTPLLILNILLMALNYHNSRWISTVCCRAMQPFTNLQIYLQCLYIFTAHFRIVKSRLKGKPNQTVTIGKLLKPYRILLGRYLKVYPKKQTSRRQFGLQCENKVFNNNV